MDMNYSTLNFEEILKREFTQYIKLVVAHAKIDYIRFERKHANEIPVEKVFENDEQQIINDKYFDTIYELQFEEERLEKAFFELPLLKRQALIYIFAHGLTAKETAQILQCSEKSIANLRFRTLKKLRTNMAKEYNDNEDKEY